MVGCLDDIVRNEDNFLDTGFVFANIEKFFAALTGDKERSIRSCKKLVGLSNNPVEEALRIIELGNLYDKYDDNLNAGYCYNRAVRILERAPTDWKVPSHAENINFFKHNYYALKVFLSERFKIGSLRDYDYINYITSEMLLNNRHGITSTRDFIRNLQGNIRRKYILARIYAALINPDERLEDALNILSQIIETDVEIESISAGKSEVIVFTDSFFGREVVAKLGKLDELKREMQTTQEVIYSVRDLDNVIVPLPIGITKKGNIYYYFIERELGDSLDERINSGNVSLDDFYNIADTLGAIHARVSTENREERDVSRNIEKRLLQFGFYHRLVGDVVSCLSNLLGSLEGIVRVYNKDAHPRNWKFGENGDVIVIDNEYGRLIPITFDDASLLDQHNALNYEDRLKVAKRHWAGFNSYSRKEIIQDEEMYELAYLNSVIIRAFEIYKQAAEIGRHDIKHSSIANARSAIRTVRDKFCSYYFDHFEDYSKLDKALGDLQSAA